MSRLLEMQGETAKRVKIAFVLLSSSRQPLPSTRIAVLNMLPYMRSAGFEPHIVHEPDIGTEQPRLDGLAARLAAQGFRLVFLQKVHGPDVEALVRELKRLGIKTVFGVCDLVDAEMVSATDATVAVTDYLKSLYPVQLHRKIHVVHDGIENPWAQRTSWRDDRGSPSRPLRAVLVTSSRLTSLPVIARLPAWLEVVVVGRYPARSDRRGRLRELRWTLMGQPFRARWRYLRFLLDRRIRCVAWDPMAVYEEMQAADIGIIPIERADAPAPQLPVPAWKAKSENRLTMKMSIGLPVIATPIPSYESIVEHGVNGFLAHSRAEWLVYLDALRDPRLREEMGQRARLSVQDRYSMDEQARRLIKVFREVLAAEAGIAVMPNCDSQAQA